MTKRASRAKSSKQGQRLAAPSPLLRLKNELFYSRNWLSTTIEEFVGAVDSYIRWYNEARIKMSLGFRSPIEHRRNLGLAA